jgi:type IV secretion system protein VirD4
LWLYTVLWREEIVMEIGRGAKQARRPTSAAELGLGETLAWVGVAVVAGVAMLVWSTGEVAGRLNGGRWPAVGVDQVPDILARLPGSLTDPKRAWPPSAGSLLPGPLGLYGSAALLLAILAGAGLAGALTWRRSVAGGVGASIGPAAGPARAQARGWRWPFRRRAAGARWATPCDLRRLRVRKPGDGRLVLGRVGQALIASEARQSVLVVGPTQTGKTTGLAIPALLEWPGPVVATSVKGDLVAHTREYRAQLGTTWVFDPTASAGAGPSSGWSPLQEATTWNSAQRVATWLVEATPSRAGLSEGAFWFAAAAKLLAPLLLAAAGAGRNMADVVRWTNVQETDEVERLLGRAGAIEAGVAFFASVGRDERIKSSIYTTLETVLAPYEDPVVAAAADAHEIDPEALVAGHHTLYLCGPAHEQARLQGVFATLVASVVNAAVERVQRTGGPLDPPLLLVLDEVANIAPLRDLDTLASTAAGMGIQLVTVCQDLAQLAARYGTERARTIANNHRAKVILSGVADVGTLDTLSGLAGEQAVREQTITADLRDGRRTTSSSVGYRRLAPADELRRIRPGEGVLVYGYLPPARLELRPWYRDSALRRRAAGRD